ncbi:MAG: GGDEF domain-containing protein [Candidatus Moranbacteria bacterium]|jgi:diguanylate cyclase (GGDEF)-like protein|nr:GGDEF domain-containing protein [Candidatus Moranbacteria bacterium]
MERNFENDIVPKGNEAVKNDKDKESVSVAESAIVADDINEKKISKREEVDKLKADSKRYEDLVYDLALIEDGYRKELKSDGISGERLEYLADKISDEVLERIKAKEAKWVDEMTGLRNKNAYKEELPQMLEMERRMGEDCSILMIDFDHFKRVNDIYGHLVGDEVLKKMANLIKSSLRASDIVYRYGGEEFVAFLPNTKSIVAAQDVAEKVRATIESHVLEVMQENGENIKLKNTISIGVVGTDQLDELNGNENKNIQKLLEEMTNFADKAVYLSKKEGRNRVTLYEDGIDKNKEDSIISKLSSKFKALFYKN